MSAFISRASMSSVTPGSVAIRTPAWLAARRAAVWESDWIVGASTTSAATIAAATGIGGSAPLESSSEITASVAKAPSPSASIRISAPISSVTGLQIDQHLFARFDPQAVPQNRPHRHVELLSHPGKLTLSAPRRMPPLHRYDPCPAGVAQLVRAAES